MGHVQIAATGAAGPTLWSHGTKQYGVFVASTGTYIICQFNRSTKALEATFDLADVSGNPLNLPVVDLTNIHRSCGIGVTPNGILYASGNHHAESTLRIVKFTTGGDITNPANWTDAISEFFTEAGRVYTYPFFFRFAGSTVFTYGPRSTAGGAGNSPRGQRWFRHNGTAWSDLGFVTHGATGTDDAMYFTQLYVEGINDPHPNRGHWFGAWDYAFGGVNDFTVDKFSYLYTDDEGTTWRNIAGVQLTTPFNSTGTSSDLAATGITFGDPTLDNMYASGCSIDEAGYPCGSYIDRTATPDPRVRLIRWNGSTWIVDTDTYGFRYGGSQDPRPLMFRGHLCVLARPLGAGGDNTKVELRRAAAPNEIAHIAAPIGTGWFCYWDPVAFRETGVIEMLHINDDVPRVVTVGNHARAIAAS